MKGSHLLRISLFTAALVMVGCDEGDDHDHDHADEVGHDETTGDETGEVDLANGQAIHDGTCMVAGCHADNGVMLEVQVPAHTDGQLFDIVDMGTDLMPAQNQLSDQDIDDVVAYLRMTYG